jgi:hypothetical protein
MINKKNKKLLLLTWIFNVRKMTGLFFFGDEDFLSKHQAWGKCKIC